MRATWLLLGAALALAMTVPGTAQQQPANSFFTGVNPRDIKPVYIDTSKAMKALNVNNAFRPPPSPKAGLFNLGNVFPKITMPSWPPKIPTTSILPQKNNPFQPNPIVGTNPFNQTK